MAWNQEEICNNLLISRDIENTLELYEYITKNMATLSEFNSDMQSYLSGSKVFPQEQFLQVVL